jgi:Zn-dependent protease with chaperone function
MIEATYFDGRSTLRQPVVLAMKKRVVGVRGADGFQRVERLSHMDVSEKLLHAPRILRFADGAFVEVSDSRLDRLLAENGYRDPWVVRWQQNWPMSLFALVVLFAVLIVGYQWGLPWAADRVAQHLPASVEQKIGDQELKMLDGRMFGPTRLDPVQRERLQRMFGELQQPRAEKTSYRIEFRDSRIGPNAFALPNGVIVMTDQMVEVAGNDQALLGVLCHELGHLQRRHSLRHILQALGIGAMVNVMFGDVSAVLTALPTFLLDKKYSRDFEREADQYAIDMMQENDLPLSPMADLFERMEAGGKPVPAQDAGAASTPRPPIAQGNDDEGNDEMGDEEGEGDEGNAPAPVPEPQRRGPRPRDVGRSPVPDYFSSHPSDAERIARFRAADAALTSPAGGQAAGSAGGRPRETAAPAGR